MSIVRISTDDYALSRIQDNVCDVVDRLSSVEILRGRQIDDIDVSSGVTTNISHGLGRAFRGYIVVRQSLAAQIWETTSPSPSKLLSLTANDSATISLWVY